MRVLNIIWAFGTGGIGKLFLTYAALGEFDPELQITSVCIDLQNCAYDRKLLEEVGIRIVAIKNRKDLILQEILPGEKLPIRCRQVSLWFHTEDMTTVM